MARRPLPEMAALSVRIARGCEGHWAIMLRLDRDGPFTVSAIDAEGNSDRADVAQYVRRLVKAGIVREVSVGVMRGEKVYRLVRRPLAAPRVRRDGTLVGPNSQQRIWNAIRTHREGFDIPVIAFAAGDRKPLPLTTVRQYVLRLDRAGYLARLGYSRWRLRPNLPGKPGNTGPLAPTIHRVELLWDRNALKVMGDDHVAEEVA